MPRQPEQALYPSHHRAVGAFMGVEDNRDTPFLRSVYSGYLRYSRYTEAQEAAIRRIMAERGWTFSNDGTATAPAVTVTAESLGEPATWNDSAGGILNGQYTVQAGMNSHKFRIFTITRTQREGLRHKRVVAWYNDEDYEWETFAYLTTTGRLKVWRRFQDDANEEWQLMAKQLLAMLRESAPEQARITQTDPTGVSWTVIVSTRTCRYCAAGLVGYVQLDAGHDACVTAMAQGHAAAQQPDPQLEQILREEEEIDRRQRSNYSPPRRSTVAAAVGEVHTYSELGTGWEQ